MGRPVVDPVVARSTFDALRRPQGRARSGPLRVSYAPIPSASRPQVAFSVPRRCGGAVERNRIRRRLRAALRQFGGELAPGAYLIQAGETTSDLDFDLLITNLSTCMARASSRGEHE